MNRGNDARAGAANNCQPMTANNSSLHTQPVAYGLELKIPPVAMVFFVAFLMWVGAVYVPGLNVQIRFQSIAIGVFGILGVISCSLGILEFKRAKTTVNPTKPETSSSLVTSGIYKYTRNPMYLGFLLILAGWEAAIGGILSFLLLPGFVLYLNRFQIKPEERALVAIFGNEFTNYCAEVRRWI